MLGTALALTFASAQFGKPTRQEPVNPVKFKHERNFMQNKGQWNSDALFLQRAAGQDFWVTKTGYKVDVYSYDATWGNGLTKSGQVVEINFLGASQNVAATGLFDQPGRVDFVPTLNPERSITGVTSFKETMVRGMYPGIDVRYYAESGVPRYDLIVAPNANPEQIQFEVVGANSSSISADGTLSLQTNVREIKQTGLFAYQLVAGKKVQVKAAFRELRNGGFGFKLGSYDSTKPLVIDPIVYGTFLGGDPFVTPLGLSLGPDDTMATTSDSAGNVYISGTTSAPNFPITSGPYSPNISVAGDGFIAAIDGDAYDQKYGAYIIGSGTTDTCQFLQVDQYGDLWLAGETNSAGFPSVSGTRPTTVGFFMRFKSDPLKVLDPLTDPMSGLLGNLTANTNITGFGIRPRPTGTGLVELAFSGNTTGQVLGLGAPPAGRNGFIIRRDFTRNPKSITPPIAGLSNYLGSTQADEITSLAVGPDGGVYVTGTVGITNLNFLLSPTSSVFATTPSIFPNGNVLRGIDCFIRKYRADGVIAYSGVFGSSQDDVLRDGGSFGISTMNVNFGTPLYDTFAPVIAVDQLGNAYVSGIAGGFNFPKTRDAFIQTFSGGEIFVTKFNPSGTQLVYSTSLGSSLAFPTAITVDFRGNAYVGGVVSYALPPLPNLPTTPGSILRTPVAPAVPGQEAAADNVYDGGNRTFPPPLGQLLSGQEGFITVVNNTGTSLNYSSYIGANGANTSFDDAVASLYIDQTQSLWISGYSRGLTPNWLTPNAFKTAVAGIGPSLGGDQDGIVLKYRFGLPVLANLVLATNEIPGGLGANVVGQVSLRAPAPVGGTIITLRVTNPAIARFNAQGGPSSIRVTIPQGQTLAQFTMFSNRVLEPTFTDIRAEFDSDLLVTRLNVRPWLTSFNLGTSSVNGGNTIQGVVTLFNPAPTGGVQVFLAADNPSLVEFPNSVITVPAGQQFVSFDINTNGVSVPTPVAITATVEGVGQTQSLTLNPATVLDISFDPTTINGGERATGTIRLDGEAVAGTRVELSRSGFPVSHPTFVFFNPGDRQNTFELIAPPLASSDQSATITGTLGISTATSTIVIEANEIIDLQLSATNVLGGTVIDASVRLQRPAAASGFKIPLVNSTPTLGTLSTTEVTVAPGATSATFQIFTNGLATTQTMVVSCDKVGYNRNIRSIIVRALEYGITFNPNPVQGGSGATGTITLQNSEVAPFGGLRLLLSANSSLVGIPTQVLMPAGASTITFAVTTQTTASDTNVTISAGTAAGVQRSGNLLVKGLALVGVTVVPNTVVGGRTAVGTVTIDSPAPAGGLVVTLTSSNTAALTMPATVTIPANGTSATFTVTTKAVATTTGVTVSATRGTVTRSTNVSVVPAVLQSLTFSPQTVRGTFSSTGTITIDGVAPAGGLVISLSADKPAFVGFPGTVTIPAGASTVTFTVTTTQVTRNIGVIFTATSPSGSSINQTLFIEPNT